MYKTDNAGTDLVEGSWARTALPEAKVHAPWPPKTGGRVTT